MPVINIGCSVEEAEEQNATEELRISLRGSILRCMQKKS